MKKQNNRSDSAQKKDVDKSSLLYENQNDFKMKSESSPSNNNLSKFQQRSVLDPKWSEIKIYGKNICRRSYHSAAVHEDRMYIYGGYEVNEGILGDFYEMMWQKVNVAKTGAGSEKTIQPGPLMRHSAVSYKDKMYLFGGNQQSLKPSNQLWSFDYNEDEWELIKPNGEQIPPSIDSHSAVVDEFSHCMYIFGGFSDDTKDGGYQNKVWKYSFESSEWTLLGENSTQKPSKRAGSCITLNQSTLYMFGGTAVDAKFNDIWAFDLEQQQWEHIKMEKDDIVPETRNGHTLLDYKDKLILFGGIHDITHEKNDMFVFNVKTKKWYIVDDNTSHNQSSLNEDVLTIDQNQSNGFSGQHDFALKEQNNKTITDNSINHGYRQKTKNSSLEKSRRQHSPTDRQGFGNSSRLMKQSMKKQNDSQISKEESHIVNNQLEENRKKRILIKKMNLLSEFELNEEEKTTLRPVSPTTENMKNSIVTVGNPLGKTKYSLRILDSSINRSSNQSNEQRQNKMIGRRPCARDGHTSVICDNQCYIFGGDRHMMSYNDLFSVDLDKIIESLP